jgi:hypothetical protein
VSKLLLGLVSSSLGAALSCYLAVVYWLALNWVDLLSYVIQVLRKELPGQIVPAPSLVFGLLFVVGLWEASTLIASILHAGWNGTLASVAAFVGTLVLFWPNAVPIEIGGVLLVAGAYFVAFVFRPEP